MLSSLPLGRSATVTMRLRSDSAEALCGPQPSRERPLPRPLGAKQSTLSHRLVLTLARSDSAADDGTATGGGAGAAPLSPPRCAGWPCPACPARVAQQHTQPGRLLIGLAAKEAAVLPCRHAPRLVFPTTPPAIPYLAARPPSILYTPLVLHAAPQPAHEAGARRRTGWWARPRSHSSSCSCPSC